MEKIKLSEFIRMSPAEMSEHMKKCNLENVVSQLKPSICEDDSQRDRWSPKYTAYDLWSGFDKFNIEADECGWEVIPHIIYSFCQHEQTLEETISKYQSPYYMDSIVLKKTPKYDELVFLSVFYSKRDGIKIVSENLGYNDSCCGSNFPLVLIGDKHKLCHFGGLPLKFRTYKENVKGSAYNEYHMNSVGDFVLYPYMPMDISIYDYGMEVERFAKTVSENPDMYYRMKTEDLGLSLIDKNDNTWRSSDTRYFNKKEVDVLNFISLKYMFPCITAEDYNKVHEVVSSEMTSVMKFVQSCIKAHNDRYGIGTVSYSINHTSTYFSSGLTYASVIDCLPDMNLGVIASMFERLDEFRAVDVNAVDTKKRQEKAKEEYEEIKKKISYSYGRELAAAYKKTVSELTRIEKEYNGKMKEINGEMLKKYEDVDISYIVWNDEPVCLTSGLKKSMSFISCEAGAFGNSETFTKILGLDKIPANVKKHIAKAFEALPDIDHIVISSVRKSDDAPYEVYGYTGFSENNGDLEDMLIEKWGKKAADKWIDKFDSYDFSDKLNEDDGSDLYPGCYIDLIVSRDFEFDYVDGNN